MRAHPGDQILIRGHHVGEHVRKGEVIEVHGDDGGPPYLIRWDDDGHESLLFPGSDAVIEHLEAAD